MITAEKTKLINECLDLSRRYPGKVVYGFITRDNKYVATLHPFVIRERQLDGDRVYVKALNGGLIL